MKLKYIVGTLIIVVFLIFAGISFQSSLTPYVSLAEARAKGTVVQVKGSRVAGSEDYNMEQKTFHFRMTDNKGEEFQVVYEGVKPSNFERAKEIVAIGRFQDGVFHAQDLLVKCPSKYEAEAVEGVRS